MRKMIVPMLSLSMLIGAPVLVGCDREVKHDETTKTRANGDTVHSETTVKEKPNGDVVKEHHESVDNTRNP